MEYKFPQLLESYGVSAEQTTKKIANMVNGFEETYNEYKEAFDDLDEAEDEKDRDVRLGELKNFEDSLNDLDNDIVKQLEIWNKNKDIWDKGRKVLAEKRAAKKAGLTDSVPQPVATQVAPEPIQVTPQPMSVGADGQITGVPDNSGFKGDGGVIKKKSNAGWWILAGFIGVVTLGAVMMKKE
jgi:hypothetical protein